MKNGQKWLILCILGFLGLGLKACPIRIKNDGNVLIWVVTGPMAEKLGPVVTIKDIHVAANTTNAKNRAYNKVRIGETDKIGSQQYHTYFVYVQAGNSGQFIKLYQINFKRCLPKKQQDRWLKANTLTYLELKNNILTTEQKNYLQVADLSKLFGYTFAAAFNRFKNQEQGYWYEEEIIKKPTIEELFL